MSQSPQSTPGPLARHRERRRARRQERLERQYFEREQRCSLDVDTANRTARASAYGLEGGAGLSGFDGGGGDGGA